MQNVDGYSVDINYTLQSTFEDFVDRSSGTCSFDSKAFVSILQELLDMGLSIPKVTQVCERLRSMGLPIQDGIYTLEAATAELLKLAGKGGAVC